MLNIAGASLRVVMRRFLIFVLAVCALSFGRSFSLADDALHVRIDRLSEEEDVGPRGDQVDDLTFLRRVTLDLAGRIPSIDEARALVGEPSADRRVQVVDRLISGPEFTRHLAVVFDNMLMERRGDKHVKSVEFREWLEQCFEQKRPYNEIVRDLLSADGTDERQRAAAAFFLERDVEPNLLTREVGRMFLGIDLQCAQCHNHPLIDDYHQSDYFGLFSFVSQLTVFRPDAKKPALIGETVGGQSTFKSVFTEREAVTAPRLPGDVEIIEPEYVIGDEYTVRPAKNIRPVPRFSRRDRLAELIASGQSPLFRRNIVNRLWAMMMGRGLVHPVDQHHSENPPSNPALLDLLADEFAKSNYDVSNMLREIALSSTYQRSWQLPDDPVPVGDSAGDALASLGNQVAQADAEVEAMREEASTALARLDEMLAEAAPLRATLQKAVTAAQAEAAKVDTAVAGHKASQVKFEKKQSESSVVRTAADSAVSVASRIADDKELTAAAEKLKEKASKLESEMAGLKKALDESAKNLAAAQARLAEANSPVEEARKALVSIEARIRDQRAKHVAIREQIWKKREFAQHSQRKSRFLEHVLELGNARKLLAEAQPQLARLEPVSRSAQAEFEAAENARQNAAARMKKATDAFAVSQTTLAELQAELNGVQEAADSLSQAVASAERSIDVLGNESERDLAEAVAALDSIQKRLGGDLAGLQSGFETQRAVTEKAGREADAARIDLDAATARAGELKKRHQKLAAEVAELRANVRQGTLVVDEVSDKVIREASSHFNIAVVVPLTPEQLAWSILQATGQLERQRAAELAKINKERPMSPEEAKDEARIAQRNQEADAAAYKSLNSTVGRFVTLFGGEKGQPQDAFFATVEQALFFANGGEIRSWLSPSGENLTGRLLKHDAPGDLAEELYLSTFTRMPDENEIAEIAAYLEQRKEDRSAAVQEIAWALLTSVEFRFHR